MPVELHPFAAFRPRPEKVADIASPPYDVLSSDEARAQVRDRPLSFLHVVKPEIDLPADVDVHDARVYSQGRANLDHLLAEGFVQDPRPCLYLYQQRMGAHVQTGLVAGASVFDYEADRIKKHEQTREAKERDRIRHVETLAAHTGPVFLTYPHQDDVDARVARLCQADPVYDFISDDGIGHRLWVVDAQDDLDAFVAAFARLDCLYVADGHHRSAAATAVARARREAEPDLPRDHEINYFLSVIFADNQMQILDYNRVVRDLNGHQPAELIDKLRAHFEVQTTEHKKPDRPRCFGMYLDGQWYRLSLREAQIDEGDPVASLDVSILQNLVLSPLLGIGDPRSDERIDFVGGIRGPEELERRCSTDMQIAFSVYPTLMQQLMAIADAGKMMPPKSTWFEPKLRSGLIVHRF